MAGREVVGGLTTEQMRQMNRDLMPGLAALVDEVRAQVPGAKLVWGREAPHDPNETIYEVGRKNADRLTKMDLIPRAVDQ